MSFEAKRDAELAEDVTGAEDSDGHSVQNLPAPQGKHAVRFRKKNERRPRAAAREAKTGSALTCGGQQQNA